MAIIPQTNDLLRYLDELIQAHRSIFKQESVYQWVVGLVFAEILVFARHTLTQLLLALGLTEHLSPMPPVYTPLRNDRCGVVTGNPGLVPCKEWEAAVAFLTRLRQQLSVCGRDRQRVLMVGDGHYDNLKLWQVLPDDIILLYHWPVEQAGRGRRRM